MCVYFLVRKKSFLSLFFTCSIKKSHSNFHCGTIIACALGGSKRGFYSFISPLSFPRMTCHGRWVWAGGGCYDMWQFPQVKSDSENTFSAALSHWGNFGGEYLSTGLCMGRGWVGWLQPQFQSRFIFLLE